MLFQEKFDYERWPAQPANLYFFCPINLAPFYFQRVYPEQID